MQLRKQIKGQLLLIGKRRKVTGFSFLLACVLLVFSIFLFEVLFGL